MRSTLISLLAVALLSLPPVAASAQTYSDPCGSLTAPGAEPCQPVPPVAGMLARFLAPDACAGWAAQQALPALSTAYAFDPMAAPPYGAGPLARPFGATAYGPATLYGPPGLVPAFGPLGPGPTAMTLLPQAFPNGLVAGTGAMGGFQSAIQGMGIAGVQLGELGNLYARDSLGTLLQTEAGVWTGTYATQASATYAIMRGLCHGMQQQMAGSR